MNSEDSLYCSLCRTLESGPNEGEGQGEKQCDDDGLRDGGKPEVGHSLLFTL